jgi:hypothetical protein
MSMLPKLAPLLVLLTGCGDSVKISACRGSDSQLECQMCCSEEGCDPDRANFTTGVQFGCACFPPESGDTDACL